MGILLTCSPTSKVVAPSARKTPVLPRLNASARCARQRSSFSPSFPLRPGSNRNSRATSLKSLEGTSHHRQRRNIYRRSVLKNSSPEISGIQFFPVLDARRLVTGPRGLESKSRAGGNRAEGRRAQRDLARVRCRVITPRSS